MQILASLRERLAWPLGRRLAVWYHPAYRLPLANVEASAGIEPRRADFVIWYLTAEHLLAKGRLREPERIPYADLARVHEPRLLDALTDTATLARIYAVDAEDLPVDEVMRTVRLACGATLGAAGAALARGGAELNLLGGFHHAAPGRGAALCPVNDVAVAIAALRAGGLAGRVVVLDLDAHPPDGTAACLRTDPSAWIGSLSGCDWGPLEVASGAVTPHPPAGTGTDETVLPVGAGDRAYLTALDALLGRMPRPQLAFVIAGGDVLAGDRLGQLGLTLAGARERDRRVAAALAGVPSVWLPGGGYREDSWKVLAGTALVLAGRSHHRIPERWDPLAARFAFVAARLTPATADGDGLGVSEEELAETLGMPGSAHRRLLGVYSAEQIEHALHQYGVLDHLQRLGYSDFRVELGVATVGERARLFAQARGSEHMLVEVCLERSELSGRPVLFVHWLTLRHPIASFRPDRPRLPGQDAPGLGMSREAGELLANMARRLALAGVAFRPSWYHVAFTARLRMRFADAARQGRFEAMLRDLDAVPLLEATRAVAEGRVTMNGEPYRWEADEMVAWLDGGEPDPDVVAAERERVRFALRRA